MSDVVISAEHLSKSYLVGHRAPRERYTALRDVLATGARGFLRKAGDLFAGRQIVQGDEVEEFWALKDVNFEVKRGEVLGIIGRNGAGKSTLLKILSRITEPSEGRVTIRGRVASLLEVGTGFHPELTGRENIYLNGAILGMTRAEIRRKFDEIVAFAEVEQFLDTPVKRYSSGMYVRLAFAVAAHLDPEILLVDEVLAVGDAKFQNKCLGKIEAIGRNERTVILVSHNMQAIRRLAQRTLLLSGGTLVADNEPNAVISRYLEDVQSGYGANAEDLERLIRGFPADPNCRLIRVSVSQDNGFTTRVDSGKSIDVEFEYEILRDTYGFHAYFRLFDDDANMLFESVDCGEATEVPTVRPGIYKSVGTIPANFLGPRRYELEFGVAIANSNMCIPEPIRINIEVSMTGTINQIFPGYVSPGKLLPSFAWRTEHCLGSEVMSGQYSEARS